MKEKMEEKTIKIGTESYVIVSDDDYLDVVGQEFDPHIIKLFQCLLKPEDIVFDIGANIGITSIFFGNTAQKVYAFEPSPSTFLILQQNLSRAQMDNVKLFNLGLGNKQESLTLTMSENNRSGAFISDMIKLVDGHITERTNIDLLDSFCLKNKIFPDFIKIDVEGFEKKVIEGGIEIIKKYKPNVLLELNHFCLNVFRRITIPDFLDFLRSIFPFLYAVDVGNAEVINLYNHEKAYYVMHEHLTRFRFPNLVGGFTSELLRRI